MIRKKIKGLRLSISKRTKEYLNSWSQKGSASLEASLSPLQ